jgi:serine/threonine-protein kinase RsbW
MEVEALTFSDLETALDDTHDLFERWMAEPDPEAADLPNSNTLYYARLALHEWLANLIQHAHFEDGDPEIDLEFETTPRHIHCSIVDNSTGFELETQLRAQLIQAQPFPERTMGLRIINACAEQLSYDATTDGRYQLTFSISTSHLPCLNNLF